MPGFSRYFTPQEANALLPLVSRSLDRAQAHARRYRELIASLRKGGGNARALLSEAEKLKTEVEGMVEEIQGMGVELKGLDTGLVDFPSLRAGEEVLLCWKPGETAVEWWHPVRDGFAGRQRIDPLDGSWELWN